MLSLVISHYNHLTSLVVDVRLSGVTSSVVLVVAEVILQSQH